VPRKTPDIEVSPGTLEWARASAGFTYDDIARCLGITATEVVAWTRTDRPVRLRTRQLEQLADCLRRPLAAFLLATPPSEPKLPQDFRRPDCQSTPLSSDLKFAIRRARRLQRIAREMLVEMEMPSFSKLPRASLQQEPEIIAKEQRESFGISVKDQIGWRDPYQALKRWRDTLERHTVLTFQSDFPRREAQGFSLSESHPYAIIVSSQDPPTARCFTLFHELGHLLLSEGGICLTDLDYPHVSDVSARTENWCHRFAEAFLIDAETLCARPEVLMIVRQEADYLQSLKDLARVFKVSQAAILFRMRHCQLISEKRFWHEYKNYLNGVQDFPRRIKEKDKKKGGGPSPSTRAVQERGRLLTRTVLDALDRQIIGYTEVADYLGVRLQHLDRIRQIAHS